MGEMFVSCACLQLICPLPATLTDFLSGSDGTGTLSLTVRHDRVLIPFVNANNELSITLTPPSPPAAPSPPLPPAPASPGPLRFPWYTYTTQQFASASTSSSDVGIRLVPVYSDSPISWSFTNYANLCKEHEVRAIACQPLSCLARPPNTQVPQAQLTHRMCVCSLSDARIHRWRQQQLPVHRGHDDDLLWLGQHAQFMQFGRP